MRFNSADDVGDLGISCVENSANKRHVLEVELKPNFTNRTTNNNI